MELENINLSEVSQTLKAKAACSLSYVEYRLIQMQHCYETLVTVRGGEGKRRKLKT
jgi:hypothetical protein